MEKEDQRWDQVLEEVEKEEDSLKLRRSRVGNENSPIESASAAAEEDSSSGTNTQLNGSGSKTNGHMAHPSGSMTNNVVEESVAEKDGPENAVAPAANGVHKEAEIAEEPSKSNNCVYYDKDERHSEQNHGDDALGIRTASLRAQKNLNSVIDYEHEGIQKNVDSSIPQHSEILPEESITSYNSSKVTEINTVGIDLADESYVEEAELDVETVLQKQNTHDLYCPNCNSCITRRVILQQRKRQVHITSEDVKRNKLETITDLTAKDSDYQTTSDQGPGTSDIHLDGTSELAENEYERERDIFRCLSCFSIFIPTAKGFKLFQIFGDKTKKNTMEDQQISSTLLSDRDKTTSQYGTDPNMNSRKTSSRIHILSSNLNDLYQTAEIQGDGYKALPSSSQQQLMLENLKLSAGNVSYNAKTMKKDAGDDVKNTFEVASVNQPMTSNVSNDVAYFHGDQSAAASTNRTPAPEGESSNDSISVYQPEGLKFFISTIVDSKTQEKLQEQKLDLKIQNISSDMLSMPPKASEHKEVDVNGNTISQVEVFHEHEQRDGAMLPDLSAYENGTQTKLSNNDGVHSSELPQQTMDENKVKIHSGENLKIDKDALVLSIKDPILIHNKQADTIKDLKKLTIEHYEGKDTVIVVEAGPSKTTDSRLLPDPNASAELGPSQHLATDIHAVQQMGVDGVETYEIEIIKSIVYGGLVESITSLGVVSSAAGGGTATLNILVLAMANLIGGLVLVGHNLLELKKYRVVEVPNQDTGHIDRYKELLGRRENFILHATVVVLSFIVFGLISPITYAFSFQKSDDRDFKLLAAAAASLLCIALLGVGKAYARKPPKSYFETVTYYVLLGFAASGISYAAGALINRLLEKFHVLLSDSPFIMPFTQKGPHASIWAAAY